MPVLRPGRLATHHAGRAGALIAFILLFTACSDSTGNDAEVPDEVNRAYIDGIVPHHGVALIRAEEALANAVHPGLISIAQTTIEDQGREIAQFKAERNRLFGSDTTPPPMEPAPIPPGPAFDSLWLMMMIDHHQGAIDQSLLARRAGITPLLDSLALHTIEEQQQEQLDFRDSVAAWYGAAAGRGADRLIESIR